MTLTKVSTYHPRAKVVDPADLVLLQKPIKELLDVLADKPHLDSFLMTELSLTAGISNRVKHKLGRAWRGYYVTKQDGPAIVFDASATDTSADPAQFLPLGVSMDVTIDLVVF